MKIEYTPNPLNTRVILDEHEQEVFRLKIKIDELADRAYSAYHTLTHHDWWNSFIAKDDPTKQRTHADTMKEAADDITHDYIYGDKDDEPSGLDKRTDQMFEHYMLELVGSHCGDCVCFACTCSKCMAERILKIDTIPGLGKHAAHKIECAFEVHKTIDEVLDYLKDYEPSVFNPDGVWKNWTREQHDSHLPRWRAENQQAYEWLLAYRITHFQG